MLLNIIYYILVFNLGCVTGVLFVFLYLRRQLKKKGLYDKYENLRKGGKNE